MKSYETVETVIETVAGKMVGEPDDKIVRYDKAKKEVVSKLRVCGRRVYVRKCQREDKVGLIALADKSRYDNNVCVVLAIGSGCGQRDTNWSRRAKEEKHKMDNVAHLNFDGVNILDQIILPDDHTFGITRSPYCDEEYFVSETVVEANIKR